VLSVRARLLLASAAGEANSSISQRLRINPSAGRKWRTRFIELRMNGLYDDVPPERPHVCRAGLQPSRGDAGRGGLTAASRRQAQNTLSNRTTSLGG
jgi:hypothetical protein